MSVWDNLRDSARDFRLIVWPKIQKWFGSGDLIPVEAVTESKMAKKLDMYSGIDAWYIQEDVGIRGIASRVQWKDSAPKPHNFPYNTFTIRKEKANGIRTEFEKLCNAIKNDWLYPYWFTQAYLTEKKGVLLSAATACTQDLINYIENNPRCPTIRITDATFYVINWKRFSRKHPIRIWLPTKENNNLITTTFDELWSRIIGDAPDD